MREVCGYINVLSMLNDNNREQLLRDFAKHLEETPITVIPNQFPHFTTSTSAIPEACKGCSNYGKGVCFCTLGSMKMY